MNLIIIKSVVIILACIVYLFMVTKILLQMRQVNRSLDLLYKEQERILFEEKRK